MIALRHEHATILMKGPPGGEVTDLHVASISGCYVSRWEPTPDELEMLKLGGSVELWVMGCQPPVALRVQPHAGDGE